MSMGENDPPKEDPTGSSRPNALVRAKESVLGRTLEGARHPGGFLYGLLTIPRGAKFLLVNAKLWHLAVLPLLINLILFVVILQLAFHHWMPYLEKILTPTLPALPKYLQWLGFLTTFLGWLWHWIVDGLVLVLVLLISVISFNSVGCVIAAPFNDLLSERIEEILVGEANSCPFSLKTFLAELKRTVVQALLKPLMIVVIWILTLPILLLPFGPMVVAAINAISAFWFLALEFIDLPMARAGWELKRRRAWARARPQSILGFGAALHLLLPIAFLVMPAAVAGGTILFVDLAEAGELRDVIEEAKEKDCRREREQAGEDPAS